MRLLIIGSGGREHALCYKFGKSINIKKIYCIPGNGGTAKIAENVNIPITDFDKLSSFVIKNKIDFTFVGPELPLSLGIVDYFKSKGLKILGPSKMAARLESSKIYSKRFMYKYNIPTARYNYFTNINDAMNFLKNLKLKENEKIVIKADGLAAGKGVYICKNKSESKNAINQIMNKRIFGNAGSNIIIEEYIEGYELSYLIFLDGISYSIMPISKDYKRANNNDKGLNTGGMGAYATTFSFISNDMNKKVKHIINKIVKGIMLEKLNYCGVLYIGMIFKNNFIPTVLEFNCRFGDPEAQVILPLLKSDLFDICTAILEQKLISVKIDWKSEFSVCVVVASDGYPESFEKGFEIKGIENVVDKNVKIFHSGTEIKNNKFITSSGRVLCVTATAMDCMKSAINKVYKNIKYIHFKNMYYRKDIGKDYFLDKYI
ncbi:MAG: phosphoribosylamine--glycine ligase [Endomicrobium sp.]|jgi:phosphoribosylamine--glycine ligase|nr:phosphoribosylamine--glycine ligase [Endomicrobium sp.]